MPLTINHPEVDELAQELSRYTGESVPQAVITALRERLAREKTKINRPDQSRVAADWPGMCRVAAAGPAQPG